MICTFTNEIDIISNFVVFVGIAEIDDLYAMTIKDDYAKKIITDGEAKLSTKSYNGYKRLGRVNTSPLGIL